MEITCNEKAMNALFTSICESELVRVMDCIYVKAINDNMSGCYECDNKLKKAKLQGFIMKFKSLTMHDYEDIAKYFLIVDEAVNTIRCLDENIAKFVVVQKVFISLLERFNPKVSTIE